MNDQYQHAVVQTAVRTKVDRTVTKTDWTPAEQPLTVRFAQASLEQRTQAGFRDEKLSGFALVERGVTLTTEDHRLVIDGIIYGVRRVTPAGRYHSAELYEVGKAAP